MTDEKPRFASEVELCTAFMDAVRKNGEWTIYPETEGFDILLVRRADGFQIGIEAKLRLSAKVVGQAVEQGNYWRVAGPNPDCRAVLVPHDTGHDLTAVCDALGITILRMRAGDSWRASRMRPYSPDLPNLKDYHGGYENWFERCPDQRLPLPDWIPDVVAGDKSPVALTEWKVKAIKIAVTLELRGSVSRQDFKFHKIHMPRWIDPYAAWLVKNDAGLWVVGPKMPDFRRQHPVNYEQIKADADLWIRPVIAVEPAADMLGGADLVERCR